MKYAAVIKYNGVYYVSHKLGSNRKFNFIPCETEYDANFKTSNTELRKRIAKELLDKTSFKNTHYSHEDCYKAVSLYKKDFLEVKRVAIFACDTLDENDKSFNVPYCEEIKHECEDNANQIMRWLKWQKILAPLVMYIPFFLLFLVAALFRKEAKLDLDMIAFWGVMITHFSSYIRGTKLFKRTIGSAFFYRLSKPYLDCISEALIFFVSFGVAYLLKNASFNENLLSGFGMACLFWDAMVRLIRMNQ